MYLFVFINLGSLKKKYGNSDGSIRADSVQRNESTIGSFGMNPSFQSKSIRRTIAVRAGRAE
ncbi:hypothetical protein NQ315_004916 [Exocentrus adspersus]|uniref:Uncharacterized protein n=1 Tax=Exocentrus adspersus TaxID=1586481 RepID=A0AAV8W370_9CUCU|nr:hypothetical protein NQ315_004916 [Exocentrus adspersus]